MLRAVDRVDIRVLLDFETEFSVTAGPRFNFRNELQNIAELAQTNAHSETKESSMVFCADTACCATTGFAYMITLYMGDKQLVVLFDAGSGQITVDNARKLGLETALGQVTEIAFSHRHFDHLGGILPMLDLICQRKGGPEPVHVYAHPGNFVEQAMTLPNDLILPMQECAAPEAIQAHGGLVHLNTEPTLFASSCGLWSGPIPRVTEFEKGLAGQLIRARGKAGPWSKEELVVDEAFLMFELKSKGFIVLSACSHAGIINVCKRAVELARLFSASSTAPHLHVIMGGFHLTGVSKEPIIERTVEELSRLQPDLVCGGHCTGYKAKATLRSVFGDRFSTTPVGGRYVFSAVDPSPERAVQPLVLAGRPRVSSASAQARTKNLHSD